MTNNELTIDHTKGFANLANAPIVEAVLNWEAMAFNPFQADELVKSLKGSFPDYEADLQHNLKAGFSETDAGYEFKQQKAWQGVRLVKQNDSAEKPKFVCQFLSKGIIFSQLAPYQDWESFISEALRFWNKYCELGNPSEIARLTTRFISQITIESTEQVEQYIDTVCQPAGKLGLAANQYFHQDNIELANEPYSINLIRAVQPNAEGKLQLIVDISVSSSSSLELNSVEDTLKDLRFIKNEMFFTLMKDTSTNFGGSP